MKKYLNNINKPSVSLLILLLIILIHLLLLLKLIFFPYPELFVYSFLSAKGLLAYKDIFDQHFPGIMLLPINLYSLGLASFSAIRAVHLVLIAINQLLLYKIGRKYFKSNYKALFLNFLYLLWQPYFEGYVLWVESFVVPMLLSSYLLFDENNKTKLFLSGVFIGLALIFKQVIAPLVLIILIYLLVYRRLKKEFFYFVSGLVVFPLILFVFILSNGIWNQFFYWTVTFNLTVFSQMGRKYPDLSGLIRTAPLFASGFLAMFVVITKYKMRYFLLLIFSLMCLFFAYARFDFVHLQPAIPFFICIIAIAFYSLKTKWRIVILSAYLILVSYFLLRFYKTNIGNSIAFWGGSEKLISYIVSTSTNSDDRIFSYGTLPDIYYLTNRLPPGNKFVFQFPWFMKVAESEILKGIIQDKPKIVLEEKGVRVQEYELDQYMPNIEKYLDENYFRMGKVGNVAILERL